MIKNILKYYSFIVLTLMGVVGFLSSSTYAQLFSAVLFYPMVIFVWLQILPKRKRAITLPVFANNTQNKVLPNLRNDDAEVISDEEVEELLLEGDSVKIEGTSLDIDKRAFIKLIGSAGLSLFLLAIFTKKAQAAFFGSVPGPGTVALKDTTGAQIDPAQAHPTDGYRVSQIDDSTPTYYGFTNKDGAWFILKEDASGNYRYTKGTSSFTSNWTNRASLSYDYYENVF